MTSASMLLNQEGTSVPSRTYSFCSRPRAVPVRKRFRTTTPETDETEEIPNQYGNLMYDRRVVRGNTYAVNSMYWDTELPDPVQIQKQRAAHRKMLARKRAKETDTLDTEILGPQIMERRTRIDVQTELYLEEIADRIMEADMECQTDLFLDRPETPLFIPEKTGTDVATQIEEGELFDFDIEVKPVLEVLVGKSIEQALLEVTEEEELANLKAHQCAYHELRNAEIAEVQRLEEQERRHKEEKERRMAKQTEIQDKEREVSDKIAARAFSLQYLSNLIPSVFDNLQNNGFFYDTVERDVEKGFLPYLMNNVEQNMEKRLLGKTMVDCLIKEVTEKRLEEFAEYQRAASMKKLRMLGIIHQYSSQRDPFPSSSGVSSSRRPHDHADSRQKKKAQSTKEPRPH
ncbi:radial spoke head protein 3 homolog [Hemicordylus capensis]|uniref:radial spoke head protein 3 homolog n=1 Tax=Hemicordylus capensis TaxID=884348 RepID=UPI00230345AA|nr:radial spoke head protein 3 homolog [Hemicordylus capensis]